MQAPSLVLVAASLCAATSVACGSRLVVGDVDQGAPATPQAAGSTPPPVAAPSPPVLLDVDAGAELADTTPIVQLAAGDDVTCALRASGRIWCWGANYARQLGDGTQTPRATPVRVQWVDDAVYVDLSTRTVRSGGDAPSWERFPDEVCAVRRTGQIVCWGGTGETLGALAVLPGGLRRVGDVDDAVALTGGHASGHKCALRRGGRVTCWGNLAAAQDGSLGASPGPSAGAHDLPLDNVVEVVAGYRQTCARTAAGDVHCWGVRSPPGFTGGTWRGGPAPIPLPDRATQLAVDQTTSCALLASGKVACWGSNEAGELGLGSTSPQPYQVTLVKGVDGARSIGGSALASQPGVWGRTFCAAVADGTVRCWGQNKYGQAGAGDPLSPTPNVVYVQALDPWAPPSPPLRDVAQVAMGFLHSCALDAAGAVWCWGALQTWPNLVSNPNAQRMLAAAPPAPR